MGKVKAIESKKEPTVLTPSKKPLPFKAKSAQLKENKKLSLIAKSEMKKGPSSPVVTPGKKKNASPKTTPGKATPNKAGEKKTVDSPKTTPRKVKLEMKENASPKATPGKGKAAMNASPKATPGKGKAAMNASPKATPGKAKAAMNGSPKATPGKAKAAMNATPKATPGKAKAAMNATPKATPGKAKAAMNATPKATPGKAKVAMNATPKATPGKATVAMNASPMVAATTPSKGKKRKLEESSVVEEKSPKKLKDESAGQKNKKKGKSAPIQQVNDGLNEVDKAALLKSESERKNLQDLRTLYVRFKNKKAMKSEADIMAIHPKIKHVRMFRAKRGRSKPNDPILFAFLEFESEKEVKKAHKDLSPKSDDFFLDFIGPDAKFKKPKEGKKSQKSAAQINPLRLFVNGVSSGVSQSVLHELFPKASKAVIPRKQSSKKSKFAFLEFSNPQDAKDTFEASKNLDINGHHITVLYARYEKKTFTADKKEENEENAEAEDEEEEVEMEEGGDSSEESDVENDAEEEESE